MGQYYIVVFLGPKPADGAAETIKLAAHPYGFGCLAKLLENGYAVGNRFTAAIEYQLTQDGAFHRTRLVWAGDYADGEPCGHNLYNLADEAPASLRDPVPAGVCMDDYPFIVNHTKKQYVRKHWDRHDDVSSGKMHSLAILTCEGNGRGGGDYYGDYAHVARRDLCGEGGFRRLHAAALRRVLRVTRGLHVAASTPRPLRATAFVGFSGMQVLAVQIGPPWRLCDP